MTDIQVTHHDAQYTAGVRERVPMDQLTAFFGRAFGETLTVITGQHVAPAGPPFGKYYGMPTDVVDVEAGYPVASPIVPSGKVVPGTLPEGQVVEAVHVGPFDTLEMTYSDLQRYMHDNGLTPGTEMWESYLTDPETVPNPAEWRTRICWPVTD